MFASARFAGAAYSVFGFVVKVTGPFVVFARVTLTPEHTLKTRAYSGGGVPDD